MWMDHRAKKEADEINSKKHEVLKYVGGKISLEMEIPKILWLKRNLPNSYKRVSQFFDLADFLQYKACGNNIRGSCTLACKWTYLAHKNKWDRNFFKSLGLEDLIDKNKIGNIVKEPGTFAGYLTKKSSKEMGLSMTTAFTMFAAKVSREKRIPFEVSVDPFYSESNMNYLRSIVADIESGKAKLVEHDLIED